MLQACSSCDSVPDGALTTCQQDAVFGGSVATDILFVIDDSGSMAGEQLRLRDALGSFITTLASSPISDDYQIAVTNTSVQGFRATDANYDEYTTGPSTGTPFPAGAVIALDPLAVNPDLDPPNFNTWGDILWTLGAGFYSDPASERILLHDAPGLTLQFRRNVLVGTSGSGREQPLEAMRRALSTLAGAGGANDGFLRPGARLAVIFLSDEDDCSGPTSGSVLNSTDCDNQRTSPSSVLTPVQEYVDFLKGPIGGETRVVVVGAVVGVTCAGGTCTNTMCSTDVYMDPPANRFLELLSAFDPARTTLASICDDAFDAALDQFANAVMGQTLPLVGGVADPAMLVVSVVKTTGVQGCTVAQVGTAAAASADAVYTPPAGGTDATLTFQNDCTLSPGDRIEINLICAG